MRGRRPKPLFRRRRQANAELAWWRAERARQGGTLQTGHYEYFFTTWFGLDHAFYADQRILDVGCGPRGTLEWAGGAARRVGLDPLADAYVEQLGAGAHAMEYVAGTAEAMPFDAGSFDVVACLNALDNVADVDAVAREVVRVLAPGGTFLLITDAAHPASVQTPQTFGAEVVDRFAPLRVAWRADRHRVPEGIFASLLADEPVQPGRPLVVTARLTT